MSFLDEVEPEFKSWRKLVAFLVSIPAPGWIFRGLSSYDYSPLSKLEHTLHTAGVPQEEWKGRENLGLAFFKEKARHWLSEIPRDNDLLGWFSLMQHYGAPTRLTDWTVSPFVACYFALEKADEGSDNAALWMLNADACRSVIGTSFPFGRDHMGVVSRTTSNPKGKIIEKTYPGRTITDEHVSEEENQLLREAIEKEAVWPLPLPILRPDIRMAAQQACFVCSGKLSSGQGSTAVELLMKGADREEIGKRYSSLVISGRYLTSQPSFVKADENGKPINDTMKFNFEVPSAMVKKIRLPHRWRAQALASLAMMNITADTLFPGLDGVGRTTEMYIQFGTPVSMRQYLGL